MKTLFIECNMGAAGDMLMAALSELVEQDTFINEMNGIGLENVKVFRKSATKSGIVGSQILVEIHGEHEHEHEDGHEHSHDHEHTGLFDLSEIINGLSVSEKVKQDAITIYKIIAEAEAEAHGRTVNEVHFHEVGALDAVCDIVGCCRLFELIQAEKIIVSPINVGGGFVRCSHGVLPVPAPATATILKHVPIFKGQIESELCTPTGAAILKHFADRFETMPVMRVEKIGYGMGQKEFKVANCVRVFLGADDEKTSLVIELSANIDDMTGEALGFAMETFLKHGALDCYFTPIIMKKSRPATKLSLICRPSDADTFSELIFKHTTTFGIRKNSFERYELEREFATRDTAYGEIKVKTGQGFGVTKTKDEFEDVKRLAVENDVALTDI